MATDEEWSSRLNQLYEDVMKAEVAFNAAEKEVRRARKVHLRVWCRMLDEVKERHCQGDSDGSN